MGARRLLLPRELLEVTAERDDRGLGVLLQARVGVAVADAQDAAAHPPTSFLQLRDRARVAELAELDHGLAAVVAGLAVLQVEQRGLERVLAIDRRGDHDR